MVQVGVDLKNWEVERLRKKAEILDADFPEKDIGPAEVLKMIIEAGIRAPLDQTQGETKIDTDATKKKLNEVIEEQKNE